VRSGCSVAGALMRPTFDSFPVTSNADGLKTDSVMHILGSIELCAVVANFGCGCGSAAGRQPICCMWGPPLVELLTELRRCCGNGAETYTVPRPPPDMMGLRHLFAGTGC
jgi:hypothetical protein